VVCTKNVKHLLACSSIKKNTDIIQFFLVDSNKEKKKKRKKEKNSRAAFFLLIDMLQKNI
jgi:hypothetical protein